MRPNKAEAQKQTVMEMIAREKLQAASCKMRGVYTGSLKKAVAVRRWVGFSWRRRKVEQSQRPMSKCTVSMALLLSAISHLQFPAPASTFSLRASHLLPFAHFQKRLLYPARVHSPHITMSRTCTSLAVGGLRCEEASGVSGRYAALPDLIGEGTRRKGLSIRTHARKHVSVDHAR